MRKEEKIFAREEHFCPYSKNATCSGWDCGTDCPIHPDYEDEGYSCDYDEEDFDDSEFIKGYNQGYKKGYLQRLEEQDEEYEDEIDKVLAECDSFREAYDLGVLQGEDNGYLEGYKSCLKGEACYIWDEELDELLEEVEEIKENSKYINKTIEDLEETEDCLVEPEYDTEFLAYIKELQDRVSRLHKYSDNNGF